MSFQNFGKQLSSDFCNPICLISNFYFSLLKNILNKIEEMLVFATF